MIDSSHLQVLIAVAQSNSLSEAAHRLNITQSAVSQNLKALETKLGLPVLIRQGKRVSLSAGAKKLANTAKTYTKKIDNLVEELQQESNKIMGDISIGTMSGLGKSWVASRMIEFAHFFPDLQVNIAMDFPDELLDRFNKRDLDCLILPENLTPAHSESKVLHREYCTLVYPDHPNFPITDEISIKELQEYPVIFFEENDPLYFGWCKNYFGQVARGTNPRIIVNAFGQVLQAVHQGLGVAVIPLHVLERSYFKDKVKILAKDRPVLNTEFNFIYHAEEKTALKVQTLFEFLEKEVKNHKW